MKKSYLTVPTKLKEKPENGLYGKTPSSNTAPLVNNYGSIWIDRLKLRSFEKINLLTKFPMPRLRTKGIKIICSFSILALIYWIYCNLFFDKQLELSTLTSSESFFDLIMNVPSTSHLKKHFNHYASKAHLAGSKEDEELALWTQERWINYGIIDTHIETFHPLLNYPETRRLSIVKGPKELLYEASLKESHQSKVPTFHAYSGSGNVTGPIVYINYGRVSDFQFLQTRGILFHQTIALIRHGKISRHLKVKNAELFGCLGVVLFSDPDDDGPSYQDENPNSKPYPDGPWRSSTSVERGSVQYGVGDPSTPGYPSTNTTSSRIKLENIKSIPKIPSLPISWEDAKPFLKATEGFGIPGDITWMGGLCDVNYYSGPSEAIVNLVSINKYQETPIWNVVGQIKGTDEPHRSIIIGNHRDAWGYGAVDPSSGSAVLMELVRTLGILINNGWKPRRTIIICSWDAEEYGAVGSTEWAEKHTSWLSKEAVAYLNVDYAVSGKRFSAQASPLLNRLLSEVTDQVIDPETSLSVYSRWRYEQTKRSITELTAENLAVSIDESLPLLVEPLEVDSDHVAFFHHLGISSLSMGFRGDYGVQHSELDTIQWMERFGDSTFDYHQTLTQIWGRLLLHLSDDLVLPLSPRDYIQVLNQGLAQATVFHGCLSFSSLSSILKDLAQEADQFDISIKQCKLHEKKYHHHQSKKHKNKYKKLAEKLNARLIKFESSLLDQDQDWFKHVVYGIDPHSGYSQFFPSLVEAILLKDDFYLHWIEKRIGRILDEARKTLKGKFSFTA